MATIPTYWNGTSFWSTTRRRRESGGNLSHRALRFDFDNYAIEFTNGLLTVTPYALVVSAENASRPMVRPTDLSGSGRGPAEEITSQCVHDCSHAVSAWEATRSCLPWMIPTASLRITRNAHNGLSASSRRIGRRSTKPRAVTMDRQRAVLR